MEIRISPSLNAKNFRAVVCSFIYQEYKWSEIQTAARDLARKFPEILISPELPTGANFLPRNRLWILRDEQSLDDAEYNLRLSARLRHLGIQEGATFMPSFEIIQSCLRFSLQARLAPDWNRVGPFLVSGSDFLTVNRLHSVNAGLQVVQKGVHLSVEAKILRWYPLDLLDMGIDPEYRLRFEQSFIYVVPWQRMQCRNLIVLPNLTRAKVQSISKKLVQSQAIRTYEDMKLYWFNVHGYKLPEEEPKFYCNVEFCDFGSTSQLFCYPAWCVRILEPFPVATQEKDKRKVVTSFLSSLSSVASSVCRIPLNFGGLEAMEPVSSLTSALEENSGLRKRIPPEEQPRRSVQATGDATNTVTSSQLVPSMPVTPLYPTPVSKPFIPCFTLPSPKTAARVTKTATTKMPIVPLFTGQKSAQPKSGATRTATPVQNSNSATPENIAVDKGVASMCQKPLFSMAKPTTIPKPKTVRAEPTKRKVGDDEVPVRKRTKPTIQEVDISKLAQVPGGLSKINVATLQDWCKRNGIVAKSKDKKIDLIERILTKLNLPIPTNEP